MRAPVAGAAIILLRSRMVEQPRPYPWCMVWAVQRFRRSSAFLGVSGLDSSHTPQQDAKAILTKGLGVACASHSLGSSSLAIEQGAAGNWSTH